ncbi:hypothetical protein NDU88_002474 [Pleurodeles waltl]|uniref:Uncharacterized protein n=1 Tax=Pleurodeles waltl TaxID=8319 RepID=A0AAV7NH92_PLEWA|nr:hypothetical protein NDU88_002474 [Pleurodeles waltl]
MPRTENAHKCSIQQAATDQRDAPRTNPQAAPCIPVYEGAAATKDHPMLRDGTLRAAVEENSQEPPPVTAKQWRDTPGDQTRGQCNPTDTQSSPRGHPDP